MGVLLHDIDWQQPDGAAERLRRTVKDPNITLVCWDSAAFIDERMPSLVHMLRHTIPYPCVASGQSFDLLHLCCYTTPGHVFFTPGLT